MMEVGETTQSWVRVSVFMLLAQEHPSPTRLTPYCHPQCLNINQSPVRWFSGSFGPVRHWWPLSITQSSMEQNCWCWLQCPLPRSSALTPPPPPILLLPWPIPQTLPTIALSYFFHKSARFLIRIQGGLGDREEAGNCYTYLWVTEKAVGLALTPVCLR